MSKHTPGPWTFDFEYIQAEPGALGEVFETDVESEEEANGRLMAAAPEMLAALKQARNAIQGYMGAISYESPKFRELKSNLAFVEDAIKKAEGGGS